MNKLLQETEGKGFKELSILPSTYPRGSKIFQHLLPVVSGTVDEVIQAAPSLNARGLIWRSTHPGDGEGLIGIMPSGQSLGEIEASTAVLAFLDTPEYFTSLGIPDRVRHRLCDAFYIPEHIGSIPRDIGLRGMSQRLLLNYNDGDHVRAIQDLFASQVRWIAMPHMPGKNLTITEHPNLEGTCRVDNMGHMQYGDLIHYDSSYHKQAIALSAPVMIMPDGRFVGENNAIVDDPDTSRMLQMAGELMKAVRESGKYPIDVCLQIECGIPEGIAGRAILFQVREIGPKYPLQSIAGGESNALYTWQFGPKIDNLKEKQANYGWKLSSEFGSEGEYSNTHISLSSSTLFPVGYPPAYVPIGGVSIIYNSPSQASFGHCLTRWLNWAARGGEKGPGTFQQTSKSDYEEQRERERLKSVGVSRPTKNIETRLEKSLGTQMPEEKDFFEHVRLRQLRQLEKPVAPKEKTPKEEALISRHAPLFEEKEVLSYDACMQLLGEVFDLGSTIPVSYFGNNYGGSQLELHKYIPRKKLVSDTEWRKNHNYDRPYYAIDYDRPEFGDEEYVKIMFNNSHFRPEISFRYGKSWLTIDLAEQSMHFNSDNWFILNDGGCMTGTIIYGYCPKDANGTRSIAHAKHVFGKECQKTPEYYRYQNPIIEPISRMGYLKECLFGKPEKPPFTGTKYQSHSPETLKNASDLLGPMLQRLKNALDITLHTDPRTFVDSRWLCGEGTERYKERMLQKKK